MLAWRERTLSLHKPLQGAVEVTTPLADAENAHRATTADSFFQSAIRF